MTTKKGGRPSGLIIFPEGFEALLSAKHLLKKDVCDDAGVSRGFLTDLLACRGGATPAVAERLASTLGVQTCVLFPELAERPWVPPLPDRSAKRAVAA